MRVVVTGPKGILPKQKKTDKKKLNAKTKQLLWLQIIKDYFHVTLVLMI